MAGVSDFDADSISLYPNPVKDVLNISSKTQVSGVVIYDILGKTVISETQNTNTPRIDMSGLSPGVYMVQVSIENTSKTFKIIK